MNYFTNIKRILIPKTELEFQYTISAYITAHAIILLIILACIITNTPTNWIWIT